MICIFGRINYGLTHEYKKQISSYIGPAFVGAGTLSGGRRNSGGSTAELREPDFRKAEYSGQNAEGDK